MQIKHIVVSALSLILFGSQAANAVVVKIVESGLVSNLLPGREHFLGVNIGGLPYTRTFFIDTLAPGGTYVDNSPFRVLIGGETTSALGSPRQPSVAFVTYTMAVAGMQFSSIGSSESRIQLLYSHTEASGLLIVSRSYGNGTTGSMSDATQLFFPVSYFLPSERSFIYSGIYTSVGIDNGNSAGYISFYTTPSSLQQIARYDLIPTQLVVTTVPEPSEWAMMLVGFALVGYKVKSRNAVRRNSDTPRIAPKGKKAQIS